VQCRVDTGAFADCTSPFTTTVAEGTHTITVRVTDGAGNSSSATTNNFVVDTTAPTVTITGQPAALSNNNDPAVVFTTGGAPTIVQCRLDAGTFASCSSPHTFTNVADGAHTITVRVEDAAGNSASATTSSFTIDTVGPALAFVEQPPAQWPVSYFDFTFTTGDSTAIACSLDGGAFAACASPHSVNVAYGVAHTLQVRGTDAAGNSTTISSAAWNPTRGLVLHYPWEQGDTDNTSLLKQRPAYSPDGAVASLAFVGGWAGAALGNTIAAHAYPNTIRPLTSAPDGVYTASFWIRSIDGAAGTIFTTVGATGGVRVSLSGGTQMTFQVFEGGQSQQVTTAIQVNRWVQIAMRAQGPAKPLDVFIDGNLRVSTAGMSGFNAGQAANLTVGTSSAIDLDDLRFHNLAFSNAEMCSVIARGFVNGNGQCIALAPGFEIDFEGNVVRDTGVWRLPLSPPQDGSFTFTAHTLGNLFRLLTTFNWGYVIGGASFQANVSALPGGRTLTFEFVPQAVFGRIIDTQRPCSATGGLPLCGLSVRYADNNQLAIDTATPGEQKTTILGTAAGLVPNRFNNVVITEQRALASGNTISLTVFINGVKTAIPINGGNLYGLVRDDVRLVQSAGLLVDEYEFWPADLQTSLELLCENGQDGEWDPVTNTCLLTYGP
jgi:hypothetical protein